MLHIYTRFKNKARSRLIIYSAIALVLQLMAPFMVGQANAVAGLFSNVQVGLGRMKTLVTTAGNVCAKAGTTTSTARKTIVTFPTGYTVSTTASNWAAETTTTTGSGTIPPWPAGATAWPGITTATATISSQAVTWTATADQSMTAGTTYCFNWLTAAALTNGSAGNSLTGTVVTQTNASAQIDTGSFATATVADDAIVVNATVPALFSMSFGTNIDNFTQNLSDTATRNTTGVDITIGSNALGGWTMWAKDSNVGLLSAAASKTIASTTPGTNAILTNGVEGYVTGVCINPAGTTAPATATSVVTSAAYKGNTATNCTAQATGQGSGLDGTFRIMATANGTTSGTKVNFQEKATVNTATPAATDYTDTLTIIGAGQF